MGEREQYLEALKRERQHLASRASSPTVTRRLAEVDALIDSYDPKPVRRRRETA